MSIHPVWPASGVNWHGIKPYRVNGTISIDSRNYQLAICNRHAFKPDRANGTSYSGTFWQIHPLCKISHLAFHMERENKLICYCIALLMTMVGVCLFIGNFLEIKLPRFCMHDQDFFMAICVTHTEFMKGLQKTLS